MPKKQMKMSDVFRNLKPGYWRDANGVTKSLKDMDKDYLRNVIYFLKKKRYILDFARSHVAEAMYEDDDAEFTTLKDQPSDLQFLTKILEVNAELNSRRGRKDGNSKRKWGKAQKSISVDKKEDMVQSRNANNGTVAVCYRACVRNKT